MYQQSAKTFRIISPFYAAESKRHEASVPGYKSPQPHIPTKLPQGSQQQNYVLCSRTAGSLYLKGNFNFIRPAGACF